VIVLDASAAVDALLGLGDAANLIERLEAPRESLHAPHLIDVEVMHALRRLTLKRQLSPARAAEALEDFTALRLERYPHLPFIARIWQLRSSLSAFEAVYVALGEALDAPVVTADRALFRSHGHSARIELYA
jgi:predicted nucleic acid-binding protein